MKSSKKVSDLKKNRSDWERLIREWLDSKKKINRFCNEYHISQPAFYYWRAQFDPAYNPSRYSGVKSKILEKKPEFAVVELTEKPQTQQNATLYYPNGCYVQINESFSLKLLHLLNEGMGLSC